MEGIDCARGEARDDELRVLEAEVVEWLGQHTESAAASIEAHRQETPDDPGALPPLLTIARDGVVLCDLLTKLNPPAPVKCRRNAGKMSKFFCLDNISVFLQGLRGHVGVPDDLLFEPEDIVEEKNRKQVINCLLYLARMAAEKYGLDPPSIVKIDMELGDDVDEDGDDGGEAEPESPPPPAPAEPPQEPTVPKVEEPCEDIGPPTVVSPPREGEMEPGSVKQPTSPPPPAPPTIVGDVNKPENLEKLLTADLGEEEVTVTRMKNGKFTFCTQEHRTGAVFVRCVRSTLMVRVGGGWMSLDNFMQAKLNRSRNRNLNKNYQHMAQQAEKLKREKDAKAAKLKEEGLLSPNGTPPSARPRNSSLHSPSTSSAPASKLAARSRASTGVAASIGSPAPKGSPAVKSPRRGGTPPRQLPQNPSPSPLDRQSPTASPPARIWDEEADVTPPSPTGKSYPTSAKTPEAPDPFESYESSPSPRPQATRPPEPETAAAPKAKVGRARPGGASPAVPVRTRASTQGAGRTPAVGAKPAVVRTKPGAALPAAQVQSKPLRCAAPSAAPRTGLAGAQPISHPRSKLAPPGGAKRAAPTAGTTAAKVTRGSSPSPASPRPRSATSGAVGPGAARPTLKVRRSGNIPSGASSPRGRSSPEAQTRKSLQAASADKGKGWR